MMRPLAHKITIATELATKHLHTHNKDLEASLHVGFFTLPLFRFKPSTKPLMCGSHNGHYDWH
jgi:hypothetical protein